MEQRWPVEGGADGSRVELSGAVGIAEAAELRELLLELSRRGPVTVGCGGVEHLDCAAAQVLAALAARAPGVALLEGVPEGVAGHLRRAGLHDLLCGTAS